MKSKSEMKRVAHSPQTMANRYFDLQHKYEKAFRGFVDLFDSIESRYHTLSEYDYKMAEKTLKEIGET